MKIHLRSLTAPVAIAGLAALALALTTGGASLSASGEHRQIHVTKECGDYTAKAGSFCTITSSNLRGIRKGSKVVYDQAAGIPTGMLDSNVVLDAGNGDRALGRCTLDFATGRGLCTFSDGTGELAGFHARVEVSHLKDFDWAWDGTYGFSRAEDEDR